MQFTGNQDEYTLCKAQWSYEHAALQPAVLAWELSNEVLLLSWSLMAST